MYMYMYMVFCLVYFVSDVHEIVCSYSAIYLYMYIIQVESSAEIQCSTSEADPGNGCCSQR